MNPVNVVNLHSVTLLPARTSSGTIPDLFDVRIEFANGPGLMRFSNVHVPFGFQCYFEANNVAEIQVDTLDERGLASSLLSGKPSHILLAIKTKNAEYVNITPTKLMKAKKWVTVIAGLLCAAGSYLLLPQPIELIACLIFTTGIFLLKAAKNIPTSP